MNPERRSIESVSKASLLTYPYDYMHDLYQEAFGAALDAALRAANGRLELRPSGPEAALRLLRRLRYSTKLQRMQRVHDFISSRVLDVLARGLGGELDVAPHDVDQGVDVDGKRRWGAALCCLGGFTGDFHGVGAYRHHSK